MFPIELPILLEIPLCPGNYPLFLSAEASKAAVKL
jgi:hypothetical protein